MSSMAQFGVCFNEPLARYVKLRVTHAPGMSGTFSPPFRVSDPDIHHGTCVTPVPWCMPGSLTGGFLWCLWRWKRSRHSRRMRNPQFEVYSDKRPIAQGKHQKLPTAFLAAKASNGNGYNVRQKWVDIYTQFTRIWRMTPSAKCLHSLYPFEFL